MEVYGWAVEVGVGVGVEGPAYTAAMGEGVPVEGIIGIGVLIVLGVTTITGGAEGAVARGNGVLRMGAALGGFGAGAGLGGGPTAIPTGPEAGAAVACGREVALGGRLWAGACFTGTRVLPFRVRVGRMGDAGTPAATEGLEPNDTGVAVERAAPDGEVGAVCGAAAGDLPARPGDRPWVTVPDWWRPGCEVIERFGPTAREGADEENGEPNVTGVLPPDFGVGVAARDDSAF
jgi:hypothetical protein